MSRLFYEALGNLKRARKKKGFSQEQAGLLIGCNQSQYGKKERGKQPITLLEYCTLVECFNISKQSTELLALCD